VIIFDVMLGLTWLRFKTVICIKILYGVLFIVKFSFSRYNGLVYVVVTGNDLARVLRWGPGYNGEDDPLSLLRDVIDAEEIKLDRLSADYLIWNLCSSLHSLLPTSHHMQLIIFTSLFKICVGLVSAENQLSYPNPGVASEPIFGSICSVFKYKTLISITTSFCV